MKSVSIGLIGNPNCGKTTLFNAYTGLGLRVSNRPGVTVDKAEGMFKSGGTAFRLTDLPGIYSLDCYTIEETLAKDFIKTGGADVFINVADATTLARSLYLTLQLRELGAKTVLALNMIDIAEKRGMEIDIRRLGEMLAMPVIAISAQKKTGLDELIMAAERTAEDKHRRIAAPFGDRYAEADKIISRVIKNKGKADRLTDAIDRFAVHSSFGMPLFLCIMAAVFFLTFSVGSVGAGIISQSADGIALLAARLLGALKVNRALAALITDGIIPGVGAVLTFLPNIFILFLCLGFLEDCGYMSRAAYITDSFMSRLSLSGRAAVPLLLGFGCTVPAVMAARTLENPQARRKTVFITPLIPCSARLPVFLVFSRIFFAPYSAAAVGAIYALGIAAAAAAALLMNLFSAKKEKPDLLIELPEYKMPSVQSVGSYAAYKAKEYITKAGTTVFCASAALWVLLNFNRGGLCAAESSFAAQIGRALVPVMRPAGLGFWQITVALIGGLAAKEVIVSSCGILFGVGALNSGGSLSAFAAALGAVGFTRMTACCMLLFSLLYSPCVASACAVGRESGGKLRGLLSMVIQTAAAWLVCCLVFNTARFLHIT